MIPKEFDYAAPQTLAEALALLAQHGADAKILAGGHSLVPLMKLRLAEPGLLVDLGRIATLRGVGAPTGSHLAIGAMTTYQDVLASETLGRANGLLAECVGQVGDAQVRNRGTVGGSLAHADPAADLPAVILALDAELEAARHGGGTRRIPAGAFFTGLLSTALDPGEILTQIWVPAQGERTGSAYVKLRNKASHYAVVGVAAVVTLDAQGQIARAAIGVTGAAAQPFRAAGAETALQGGNPQNGAIAHAAGLVAQQEVEWMADLSGSADYRRHMAEVLARRALRLAAQRAAGLS
ncbi:MAG TPA: xanthine dehydrogenase family protein subunit M [Chloroflexia bacterium]|nr:xanthine dehydrogenase family protein subunit M [Chloroflexia bacterium]